MIIKYFTMLSEYLKPFYYRKEAEVWWDFFEFVRENYDTNIGFIWALGNGAMFMMTLPHLDKTMPRSAEFHHYFENLVGIGIFSHTYFSEIAVGFQKSSLDLEFLGFVVSEYLEQKQPPLEALINDDYILIRWRPCKNFAE